MQSTTTIFRRARTHMLSRSIFYRALYSPRLALQHGPLAAFRYLRLINRIRKGNAHG